MNFQSYRKIIVAVAAIAGIIVINCSNSGGPSFNFPGGGNNNPGGGNGSDAGSGEVSTFAGDGVDGYLDGPGKSAQFSHPMSLAIDSQDNVYVEDTGNMLIRKITPKGEVSTLSWRGEGYDYSKGQDASTKQPRNFGIAADNKGNVYVADPINFRIQKVSPSGEVSTFAGIGDGGYQDGPGNKAKFYYIYRLAIDREGNLFVIDGFSEFRDGNIVPIIRIRKVNPRGEVSTFAGSGEYGYQNGPSKTAKFGRIIALATDSQGDVYVFDNNAYRIRMVTTSGDVQTFAGSGERGYLDGPSTSAKFSESYGVAVDNQGNVYVSELLYHRIRKVTSNGEVSTFAGITSVYFDPDGGASDGGGFLDGPLKTAKFNFPTGLAVDSKGNVYVADYINNRIRKISR